MTCVAAEAQPGLAPLDKWAVARAAVFWTFILLVIASPAVVGALVLAQG